MSSFALSASVYVPSICYLSMENITIMVPVHC